MYRDYLRQTKYVLYESGTWRMLSEDEIYCFFFLFYDLFSPLNYFTAVGRFLTDVQQTYHRGTSLQKNAKCVLNESDKAYVLYLYVNYAWKFILKRSEWLSIQNVSLALFGNTTKKKKRLWIVASVT